MTPASGYTQVTGDSINSTNGSITTSSATTATRVYEVKVSAALNSNPSVTVATSPAVRVTVNPTSTTQTMTIYGNGMSGSWLPISTSATAYAYVATTGLVTPGGYEVRWSSDNSSVLFNLTNSTSATTSIGSNGQSGYVYIYGTSSAASATITATVYPIGGNTPATGYSRSFRASVSSSGAFTISPSSGTTANGGTVYLWSGYNGYYDGYYGYDYDDAYAYYVRYGYWPSWWNNGYYNGYGYNRTANFTATHNLGSGYSVTYNWSIDYNTTPSNSSALSTSNKTATCTVDGYYLNSNRSYTLRCYATATPVGGGASITSNTLSWTIRTDYYTTPSRFTVSATVNQGDTYYLNSTNSGTSTSVIDQINNYIHNNYYYGSSYYNRYLRYLSFSTTSHTYGSLSSSSGSYNGSSSTNFSNLYFTPTTSAIGSSATASFSFTATDDAGQTYYGTLNITVKPGSTSATGFSLSGTQGENLTLSAGDFSSWWRGLYSNGTLSYVQFTSVSGGNLYANYTSSRSNVVSSTNATKCYANPSGSQTGISALTFVPSSSTTSSATLSFTAYGTTSSSSSSTVARTSTVSITLKAVAVQNVTVKYSSTGGSVPFSYSDFYYSNTAVQTSSYITFGTPSSGSLTAGGSAVSTSTRFSFTGSNSSGYQSISTVTYTPSSGYSGTASIPFYAYNANGGVVANGTVYITVTQPVQPVTPSISFSDVPKNSNTSWYYDCVARLVSNKIVGGYPDGTFKPNGSVTNGEALKMIMLAAGYAEQPNAAGSAAGAWAANYLNAAINAGIVSSSEMTVADLGKAINRNSIAAITAKALKLTPVTDGSNSPFADSKDQWVLALNKAGIIQGTTEASGTTYFYGTQSLTRAQICLIVERVMNYKQTGSATTPSNSNNNTSNNNSSTSTPSSNEKPAWLNT